MRTPDDCWAGKRNSKGELTADENWTGGTLKHIADYVHSKGMMFGTCKCWQRPCIVCGAFTSRLFPRSH